MKKILSIFLTIILLCNCLAAASADDFGAGDQKVPQRATINLDELTGDKKPEKKEDKKPEKKAKRVFEYRSSSDGEATITKWNEDKESLTIPKELDGYKVTAIGEEAFKEKKNLRSVVIPEGVVSIEDRAFSGCEALKKVTLPESLREIGKSAFSHCALEAVSLPDGVESIGESCFSWCESLSAINFPSSLSVIPEHSFENCSLTEVNIPSTVSGIEKSAFSMCGKLTKVVLPGTKVEIEGNPFVLCHDLEEIIVPDGHPNLEITDGCLIDKNEHQLICYLLGLKRTSSFAIPEGITTLNAAAFESADFDKVTFPETVTEIGEACFMSCSRVTEIELPDSVKTIRKHAFAHMSNLQKITLPKKTGTIEDDAFYKCKNLMIYVYRGSMAVSYCKKSNLAYRVIDSEKRDPEQEAFMDQFIKNPSIYDFTGDWEPYGALVGTILIPQAPEEMDKMARLTITSDGAFVITGEESYTFLDEPKVKSGCLTFKSSESFQFYVMKDPESKEEYLVFIPEKSEQAGVVFRQVKKTEILTREQRDPLASRDPDLIGKVYDLTGTLAYVSETEGGHLHMLVVEVINRNSVETNAYSVTLMYQGALKGYLSDCIGEPIKLHGRVAGWLDSDDSHMLDFIASDYSRSVP